MQGCDIVYHVAASFRSGKATASELIDINANGTRNMLDAAEKAGVSRFVHCSTIGVLGHVETPPANEDTPYNPCDDYQYSKMQGEQIALEYARAGRVPVTVVRPASIYGEGDLRLLKLFRSIKKGMFVIVGSGEPHFHMVHVDDLATGFMLAAENSSSVGEVYIIGGEHSVSINDLCQMIAEVLEVPAPRLRVPHGPVYALSALVEDVCKSLKIEPPLYRRRVDFFHHNRSFEINKAQQQLGYTPRITAHEGIRRTAQWYADQKLL
ncbi:MAG: NAD-dependent epimerase/dehydratase family protein [Chloroflexi bacterium]|nr:NAD-dependent epimerase/dehydratase family protein [Chloroflexota bacterium]